MSRTATIHILPATINQKITDFEMYLKREGRAESTIISYIKTLVSLARITTNIDNPEQVKTAIANTKWKDTTKERCFGAYGTYTKFANLTWTKPKINPKQKIPFIPTEQEIDQFIASCGKHMATILQTLKDSAIRISELTYLKWTDFDTEHRVLNVTPSKNSNPRIVPITDKTANMIQQLPKTRETIFPTSIHGLRTRFCIQRKTAAKKLQNPRILKISFHTFRHWKATMEYHKTKDIIHVKTLLGHKNINNTLIYINIEQALFLTETDQFIAKVAHNENEAIQLIELGFDYITDYGTNKIFRKRK